MDGKNINNAIFYNTISDSDYNDSD